MKAGKKRSTSARAAHDTTADSSHAEFDAAQADGANAEEQIRLRAYELYRARGGKVGDDMSDWLQAEREYLERVGANEAITPNPPRTTTAGWFTAPKFGSAGSGGAELEPGPERD